MRASSRHVHLAVALISLPCTSTTQGALLERERGALGWRPTRRFRRPSTEGSRPVRLSQLAASRCGLGKQRWGCERRLLVALQLTQWLCASCADWPAPAQWPPGGHGPPRGRAAARTRPRCAALTRRRATCPSRLWRLSAWIRRERRRTVEPQLRARKVVCTPTFDSAAGSGEIPAFFGI